MIVSAERSADTLCPWNTFGMALYFLFWFSNLILGETENYDLLSIFINNVPLFHIIVSLEHSANSLCPSNSLGIALHIFFDLCLLGFMYFMYSSLCLYIFMYRFKMQIIPHQFVYELRFFLSLSFAAVVTWMHFLLCITGQSIYLSAIAKRWYIRTNTYLKIIVPEGSTNLFVVIICLHGTRKRSAAGLNQIPNSIKLQLGLIVYYSFKEQNFTNYLVNKWYLCSAIEQETATVHTRSHIYLVVTCLAIE